MWVVFRLSTQRFYLMELIIICVEKLEDPYLHIALYYRNLFRCQILGTRHHVEHCHHSHIVESEFFVRDYMWQYNRSRQSIHSKHRQLERELMPKLYCCVINLFIYSSTVLMNYVYINPSCLTLSPLINENLTCDFFYFNF